MRRWAILPVVFSLALPGADSYTAAERRHWAFQKRSQPEVPEFRSPENKAWVRTPIDAFVLSRLQKAGITPAAKADPRTLIRRVYLDVTGVPPAPEVAAKFAATPTPEAWTAIVDSLLASRG